MCNLFLNYCFYQLHADEKRGTIFFDTPIQLMFTSLMVKLRKVGQTENINQFGIDIESSCSCSYYYENTLFEFITH